MAKKTSGGNTALLLLGLLKEKDMYGYEMIQQLAQRSENVFELKAGTLYPLLHDLEKQGLIHAWEQEAETGRSRRYYGILPEGRKRYEQMQEEWETFACAVNRVLKGGANLAKA